MKNLIGACALAVSASLCAAQTIDADDCESAAAQLKQAADDLEDAASSLGSASVRDQQSEEDTVRSEARSVLGYVDRVRSACGAFGPSSVASVLAVIRQHLLAKFGATETTKSRLALSDRALLAIAQAHVRSRPSDFRMTLAISEVAFWGAPEPAKDSRPSADEFLDRK